MGDRAQSHSARTEGAIGSSCHRASTATTREAERPMKLTGQAAMAMRS